MKLIIFALALLSSVCFGQSPTPAITNFQGRITDANGVAAPNGTGYEMEFRIWSASTGGTLIWGARYTGLSLQNGAYSVILGSGGTAISGAQTTDLSQAFTATGRYLGITVTKNAQGVAVANPSEMLPRQQYLSVPFAFNANAAGSVLPNGVDSAAIKDGSVTTTDIADSAVTAAKINDGAVTSTKMAATSVGTTALQDGAITKQKIAANTLTPDLLSPDIAVISYRVPSGTGPGAVPIRGWQVRSLNTVESNSGPSVALSSSRITLQPGTYRVDGWASCESHAFSYGSKASSQVATAMHKIGLREVSQASILLPSSLFFPTGTETGVNNQKLHSYVFASQFLA